MKPLKKNKKPFLSIITATFNEEKNIKKTLNSLINQTYKDFEYIVVDNNSSDKTVEIITKTNSPFKITIISESDRGIYDAWNKAINLASGKFCSFLGAGDVYKSDESLSNLIKQVYSGDYDFINSKMECRNKVYGQKYSWEKLKRYMNIAHPGMLMSKSFINKHNRFSIDYMYASDYDFFLRSARFARFLFVDQVSVVMDPYGVSNTKIKSMVEVFSIKYKLKIIPLWKNLLFLFLDSLKFYIKYMLNQKKL